MKIVEILVKFFVILFIASFVFIACSILFDDYKPVYRGSVEIVSFKAQNDISGSFFLASGSIDGIEYFKGFRVNKNGSYSRFKVRSLDAEIFENDNEPPRLEVWDMVGSRINFVNSTFYRIYVPSGTVIQNFSIIE